MTLAELAHGSRSLITHVHTTGEHIHRLLQLGVIPGAQAEILRAAPFGDPMQVRVEGTLLSIRKCDAQNIQVEPV
ncbi:MAG: ferrous iron transport protein A [Flavobacteriales bacterium]|jgi:ferrous iron transport protein A